MAMIRPVTVRARQHGFTYMAILIAVALLTTAAATTTEVWHAASRREKERELLFVGDQYRRAISLYYKNAVGPGSRYPRSLEDLLKDPRAPATKRYLRTLFPDPITGSQDWGVLRLRDGGIVGVFSKSELAPIKRTGFRPADRAFEGAKRYSDWVFLHTAGNTGVTPATPSPNTTTASPAK